MRMPFGRHRGLLLSEIPASYLRWLTTLDDLDERLRAAVLDELESRGPAVTTRAAGEEHTAKRSQGPAPKTRSSKKSSEPRAVPSP
jgi:Putative quorum-sensing-regulated virulence factor